MTTIDRAVFRSVGQALHVSYLMEVLPVCQRVSTQVLIDGLRKRCGVWDEAPSSGGGCNFAGLDQLEVRGQCSMVRSAVDNHLPAPERDAIVARFGHQATKAGAVRNVAEYARPLSGLRDTRPLLAITWALYAPAKRRGDEWSLRAMEREYGVSRSVLQRAQAVVRRTAQALEARADERLTDLFRRTRLVDDEELCAA